MPTQAIPAQDALHLMKNKVLLINPPVIDSRYEWVRWNQPLDLLKIGNLLKSEHNCQVKLFDFMLPNPQGKVNKRQSKLDLELQQGEQIRWQFGATWDVFDKYLDTLIAHNWIPESVFITTLTSFWWQTIPLVANRIKNKLKRSIIFLYGNYPVYHTDHAAVFCANIDVIINNFIDLTSWAADPLLYDKENVGFWALDIRSPDPVKEISLAVERGINHFVFFNENLFTDFDQKLKPILEEIIRKEWNIQFHGICGIETRDFPVDHAYLLIKSHFSELHFEPVLQKNGLIDELHYQQVMTACEKAGFCQRRGLGWESRNYYLSGFLWLGQLVDDIDILVMNALKIIQLVGMVIPKPYTPLPGSEEYKLLLDKGVYLEPEDLSPHRMPLAALNKINSADYTDIYRMTAFLNMKLRGHTFDFLGVSYLSRVIRESLLGQKWNIQR